MSEKVLEMSFDPRTIEHLGIKMYSRLPNAIAELIANAYDACSTNVVVQLSDIDNENKSIVVEDDGEGMTFDEINEKFLRIGRNRREEEDKKLSCGRIATGKKGLGKLAFFGIGLNIEIESCKNGEKTIFRLIWNDIIKTPSGEKYKPEHSSEDCDPEAHGTKITLTELKRKTKFDFESLSKSLAKLFNFTDEFQVIVNRNQDESVLIDNKLKFEGIEPEFDWEFPACVNDLLEDDYDYENKSNISGVIYTTEKPIIPGMRGVTLFANGRMVNVAEFFSSSESSHFFSYTTGWLDVDFVDNWDEDVISTNRQSLDWENEKTIKLKEFLSDVLANIHYDWKAKRKDKRKNKVQEKIEININEWYQTLPEEVKDKVELIVNKVDDSELPENELVSTIESLHSLIPEFPNFHWRHLHPEIQKVSKIYYQNLDFYNAFLEGLKIYVSSVEDKSGVHNMQERDLMGFIFGENKIKLSVTKKFKKSDGTQFSKNTIENIEVGHHRLSEGIVVGGRNPLSHEAHSEMRLSGLFTEKDCLDFLSLLSHLFYRLDNSLKT